MSDQAYLEKRRDEKKKGANIKNEREVITIDSMNTKRTIKKYNEHL